MTQPTSALRGVFAPFQFLDFLAPLGIRLFLFPIFLMAGLNKIDISTGMPYDSVVQWFGNTEWGLGLPQPEIMAYLAGYAELIGALCLLVGFAVRWVAVPLIITMLVAILTVHWDSGWAAIAPTTTPAVCVEGSEANRNANAMEKIANCYSVSERTAEAGKRLSRAKSILREHANYDWITEKGPLVVLNNGIEFAVTYALMLLSLFFMGAGRFFSIDYWIALIFRRN